MSSDDDDPSESCIQAIIIIFSVSFESDLPFTSWHHPRSLNLQLQWLSCDNHSTPIAIYILSRFPVMTNLTDGNAMELPANQTLIRSMMTPKANCTNLHCVKKHHWLSSGPLKLFSVADILRLAGWKKQRSNNTGCYDLGKCEYNRTTECCKLIWSEKLNNTGEILTHTIVSKMWAHYVYFSSLPLSAFLSSRLMPYWRTKKLIGSQILTYTQPIKFCKT